ncbi:tubulin-folding cofactor B isoform X2 [Lathamus discolor]|uniref:tubulin-folding cofactor B isoform X2 n=1 Tax=Lathamus discolor TaxID=678569 RepID=UPI0032B703FF
MRTCPKWRSTRWQRATTTRDQSPSAASSGSANGAVTTRRPRSAGRRSSGSAGTRRRRWRPRCRWAPAASCGCRGSPAAGAPSCTWAKPTSSQATGWVCAMTSRWASTTAALAPGATSSVPPSTGPSSSPRASPPATSRRRTTASRRSCEGRGPKPRPQTRQNAVSRHLLAGFSLLATPHPPIPQAKGRGLGVGAGVSTGATLHCVCGGAWLSINHAPYGRGVACLARAASLLLAKGVAFPAVANQRAPEGKGGGAKQQRGKGEWRRGGGGDRSPSVLALPIPPQPPPAGTGPIKWRLR